MIAISNIPLRIAGITADSAILKLADVVKKVANLQGLDTN